MHRHGYKGRKFGRDRDARRALMKSLASNLIESESMVTTLPKAKEIRPYVEKLITKAKTGTLHARRQIIASVSNEETAHKLVDEIAPLLANRDSGYLRIVKKLARRGDNAPTASVEFVDDLKSLREGITESKPKVEKKPKVAVKESKTAVKPKETKKIQKVSKK